MKKLLAFFLLTISAYGSITFEPYLGMSTGGEFEEDGIESLFQGPSYGLKFGAQYTYYFIGFDYRLSAFAADSKKSPSKFEDRTLNNEQYFLYFGYDFPAPFKLWAGAALGGKASVGDFEYTEGSGYLLGAAFTGLPIVSINIEWVSWAYDKVDPGSSTDLEGSHLLFSLSTPVKF